MRPLTAFALFVVAVALISVVLIGLDVARLSDTTAEIGTVATACRPSTVTIALAVTATVLAIPGLARYLAWSHRSGPHHRMVTRTTTAAEARARRIVEAGGHPRELRRRAGTLGGVE